MQATTIGIDLAKSVFQVDGGDAEGRTVLQRKLKRAEVLDFFRALPPCLVGMEACGSAHYWARELRKLGHDARLMPPAYVKAYVRRGKSDAIDARACREAVGRPDMRFVPLKTVEQQSMRALHKTRSLMVRQRTMSVNALRAHLAEHGLVAARRDAGLARLREVLAEAPDLPAAVRTAAAALEAQIDGLDERVSEIDRALRAEARSDDTAKRLDTIPGFGAVVSTAFACSVPDVSRFEEARDFAASLGVTPSHHGTGGRMSMGPISKKGDRYLRSLLILSATSLLAHPERLAPAHRAWLEKKKAEKASARLVTVALANKLARIAWALLAKGGVYDKRLGATPDGETPLAAAA